ncbi:hypothetical protein AB0P40_41680, partial [Streptomyces sp. NPDC079189]|uniref:hypothetical protein n=1 Tax=Streptomyces sp. NPDC079189 TaxID=3154514 RepID=UPI003427468F
VGLDVVGHEMTHGVTEHSAGLVYLNQSGSRSTTAAASATATCSPGCGLLPRLAWLPGTASGGWLRARCP